MTRHASELELIHVLLVDDDVDQRDYLREVLVAEGYRVDSAGDGVDAVHKFTRLDPDVVLMDLRMPVMDGWQAIREIRRRGRAHRPYVIALSGHADAHARREAFQAGCNE